MVIPLPLAFFLSFKESNTYIYILHTFFTVPLLYRKHVITYVIFNSWQLSTQ